MRQSSRGEHTILIIDEAQNLGLDALEELRMLSNVNADKSSIPAADPDRPAPVARPAAIARSCTQFAQRVSSDFHLKPLGADEVADYIAHRLSAAGAQSHSFTPEACNPIAGSSGGIPRRINILCDTALVYGFATKVPHHHGTGWCRW